MLSKAHARGAGDDFEEVIVEVVKKLDGAGVMLLQIRPARHPIHSEDWH